MSDKIQHLKKSTYQILTAHGTGTGFVIKGFEGYICTNFHVIEGFREVCIKNSDDQKTRAKVVLVDAKYDLAFLKPETQDVLPEDIAGIDLGQSENILHSAQTNVLGYPLGNDFSITKGVISSEKTSINGIDYVQTDAAVNPGNSGGPMVCENGKLLGIITLKFTDAENMGFALPVHEIQSRLENLNKGSLKDHYAVLCHSCSALIEEDEAEYCDSCGSEIDTDQVYHQHLLSPLTSFIEEALVQHKVDPVCARQGYERWSYHQGSAKISIVPNEHGVIHAISPLVELPKQNVKEALHYILAFNESGFGLGLNGGIVFLSYNVHLADTYIETQAQEIQQRLGMLAEKADELDNHLIDTFGCIPTRHTDMETL